MFTENSSYSLGIDLGSISLKVVILDRDSSAIFTRWTRVAGAPIDSLAELFKEICDSHPNIRFSSIGITGSGRHLMHDIVDGESINEITAHAKGISTLSPGVKTLIEIGGQDSKLIILGDGSAADPIAVSDFRMNELCAAGTGAFLDHQAARLKYSIEDFVALAESSTSPVRIAGRCSVFAKSDVTHHIQEGAKLSDVVAGLNEALVRGYISNLVRGKELPRPIAFAGGVASNIGIVKAFERILKLGDGELIVPGEHRVVGATGAAILAAERMRSSAADKKIAAIGVQGLLDAIERLRWQELSARRNRSNSSDRLISNKRLKVEPDCSSLTLLDGHYLGIDIGSSSVKAAVLGREGLIFRSYRRSSGKPREVLDSIMAELHASIGSIKMSGVGITGSGRHALSEIVGADKIVDEISAQARAASFIWPEVDTVIEIGGQDAKFIRIDNGRVVDFAMNRVCAAGTGSFLEEESARLGVAIDGEFEKLAFEGAEPVELGSRCAVFMESDLVSRQQAGATKADLAAALCKAVVENYFDKVAGGRRIGKRVLFLGGVAKNNAVIAALELKLKQPVESSSCGDVSGAMGAALHAALSSRDEKVAADMKVPKKKISSEESPIARRADLMERSIGVVATGNLKRIGIPRALLAFDKMTLWRTFFEAAGIETVVSPPTDSSMVAQGAGQMAAETCLPVKALCGHVVWLEDHGDCDWIFVPSYVTVGRDKHGRESVHCPYIQAIAQFVAPMARGEIVSPVINWLWNPSDERDAMIGCAVKLGIPKELAKDAWNKARGVDDAFRAALRDIGKSVLADVANGTIPRAFVMLGKDYNISDPALNSRAVEIFEEKGEIVITQDMIALDDGDYTERFAAMGWQHAKEALAASEIVARTPKLYPVFITNFGCGPDSFAVPFAREILRDVNMLILEVDEHSSSVGMETRIEAFINSIDGEKGRKYAQLTAQRLDRKIKRVFLPNFSDHAIASAAAIRALNLEPVLVELPKESSEREGLKHCSYGECHPFALQLGGYLEAARSGGDLKDACYYIPESQICRVGQFAPRMRQVAMDEGVDLPIITRVEDLGPSINMSEGSVFVKCLIRYWEMMRACDLLVQKYYEVRAREVIPGAADSAYNRGRLKIMEMLHVNKPLVGVKAALDGLNEVVVDRSKKLVRIGITGDYYTRVCEYSNRDIFREIERLGGIVMLPPTFSDVIKYLAYQRPRQAVRHGLRFKAAHGFVTRAMAERLENRVSKIFKDELEYGMPISYWHDIERVSVYMDEKLPPGLTSMLASTLDHICSGADGILNLITFHCSYGLAQTSALAAVKKDHPDMPMLTLIFEGLDSTHNRTRIEAFMEQVKAN